MSSPQEKFFSALNIAFHPSTKEGDILAGIRGAYRLLGGKTVKQFLGTENKTELAEKLAIAEAKLKGAVEHSAKLQRDLTASEGKLEDAAEFIKAQSIEICRLKTEAAKAVENRRKGSREGNRQSRTSAAQTVATAATRFDKGCFRGGFRYDCRVCFDRCHSCPYRSVRGKAATRPGCTDTTRRTCRPECNHCRTVSKTDRSSLASLA
jgi:hypothetical protein